MIMYFSTAITVVLGAAGAAAGVIPSDEVPALNETSTLHQLFARGGFLRSCYNVLDIGASTISAQCNTAAQPPTSHYTELDLNNCMSNQNGQLSYGGTGFANTCSNCGLLYADGTYACGSCRMANGEWTGQVTVNINGPPGVNNYNGNLAC